MIDLGLALLVGFSPVMVLLLLVAALSGTFDFCGRRNHHLPPLTPFVFVNQPNDLDALSPILASDRERDAVLQSIACAVGEGRLSLVEAEPRIGAALHSRHRHELADLMADLPVPPVPPSEEHVAAPRSARLALLALAAVALIAAVAVQAASGLWELWPVALAAFMPLAFRPRR